MSNLNHAEITISKTRGGIKVRIGNMTSCRGSRQFAYDLMAKLGIKTFEIDGGAGYTTAIITASWIGGEYVERGFFDVFYDYEEKCYYMLQDM